MRLFEADPRIVAYRRLCTLPSGKIGVYKLRWVFSINGVHAHDIIQGRLTEMVELGLIEAFWKPTTRTGRMSYYISVNPLGDVLPSLPDAPKSVRGIANETEAKNLLNRFNQLQGAAIGSTSPPNGPTYAIIGKILSQTSLSRAKKAAEEYWSLPSDERRSNLYDFSFKLNEMLGRVRGDEAEVERADRVAAAKKARAEMTVIDKLKAELKYWESAGSKEMADLIREELNEEMEKAAANG